MTTQCHVADKANQILSTALQLQRQFREILQMTYSCQACIEQPQCEVIETFQSQLRQALDEIRKEWNL